MGMGSLNQKSNKQRRVISDINITPFVDVLLVLLIIFMVAAPMMTSSVNVSLPEGSGTPNNFKTKPVTIAIKADGTLFLDELPIKLNALSYQLVQLTHNNLNNPIHISADQNLDYGRVMNVVKMVNSAGFKQVILVTQLVN